MLFSLCSTFVVLGGSALVSASPIALPASTAVPAANSKREASSPSVCNGHAEYCNRIYSNVSQIVSHDSAFVGDILSDNQLWSVQQQLDNGVRFLTAQSHKNVLGDLDLCHTSCWLEDAGSVQDYLGTVKTWLDGNPNEVVTVLLTNGDNVNMSLFDNAFTASGAKGYAYVPPSSPNALPIDQWPTLGDMISSGKRLVVFMDYGADPATYPYIMDEFAYFFETPFDVTDPNFAQCSIDRPAGASASGRMYLVNHNLDTNELDTGILIPDKGNINNTNAATGNPSAIMTQVDRCTALYPYYPKGVLLDYVDSGDWKTAELIMNGLSA